MLKDALLMFTIQDRSLRGNDFVAECFILLSEIENIDRMEQKHLTLSRPTTSGLLLRKYSVWFKYLIEKHLVSFTDCSYLKALQSRKGDESKKFNKALKRKLQK